MNTPEDRDWKWVPSEGNLVPHLKRYKGGRCTANESFPDRNGRIEG